jgi:hypothetical protein
MFSNVSDMAELSHPGPDAGGSDPVPWSKEICSMLTELRISECKEVIACISNGYAVSQRSFDAGKYLIHGIIGGSVDTTKMLLVSESDSEKVVGEIDIASNDTV